MFNKHVLVVDDDESILALISFILYDQGYSVTKLSDSREALYMLINKNNTYATIDLLVIDLDMPKLPGLVLIDTLREKNILVPTVLMSGSHHEVLAQESQSRDCVGYLQKPFKVHDLVSLVNDTLMEENDLRQSG